VRARGGARRRLHHDLPAGLHDQWAAAQVAADDPDERPQPVAQRRVGGDRSQGPLGVLDLVASPDGLGQRRLRRRCGRGLALLDRGQDGVCPLRRVGVRVGEGLQLGERQLGLLARLADEADGDLVDVGARVAEQALVDVADLLDVDVTERDLPGPAAP